ncbi:MAG: DMT family transporter [Allorhizobium sp.]
MHIRHLGLAVTMSIVFGIGWVFAKAAMEHFPPILLAGFRFTVTAAVLVAFVAPPFGHFRSLAITSVLAISVPYSMSYTAMKYLDVSTSVLLAQMEAPFLVLLGALLLHERPAIRQGLGIVVAMGGVALIAGDPKIREHYLAVALALGSIATWAIGQIRIRRMGNFGGLRCLAWLSLFAAPQLFAVSLLFESDQVAAIRSADSNSWLAVIYLGVVMTALGIGIWYHLIAKYPVVEVAPFLLLVPVTSILGGVLLLGDELGIHQMMGGTAIILGVGGVITYRSPKEIKADPERRPGR